jgi:RHS repeat-associated protein
VTEEIVAAAFHAHPFTEPMTLLNYVRARWYHPMTGMFLSPHPKGYIDSSNLYAYAAAEPVNQRDSSGLALYAFDGTWNDKAVDKNRTNVAKLYEAYFDGAAWYRPGPGTDWYSKHWGGLTGAGARGRIAWMYERLRETYGNDKHIDVIGFSRGAASARQFANVIHNEGVYDDALNMRVPAPAIRFLGVFDTVASFGIPGNDVNLGYDLSIPPNVGIARQAWAANEHRSAFPLTKLQTPECADLSLTPNGYPRVEEKSFRGAHADIGGGYEDDRLSRLPLLWMWTEMRNVAGIKMLAVEGASAADDAYPHKSYRKALYAKDWARVWWRERKGRDPGRTIYYPPCEQE